MEVARRTPLYRLHMAAHGYALTRRGFGARVMENMVRGQFKGELKFDWHPEGLACEIVLPSVRGSLRHSIHTTAVLVAGTGRASAGGLVERPKGNRSLV
jgi:hypothetical protein